MAPKSTAGKCIAHLRRCAFPISLVRFLLPSYRRVSPSGVTEPAESSEVHGSKVGEIQPVGAYREMSGMAGHPNVVIGGAGLAGPVADSS